jgi:predicted transcriptional regulator
MKQQAGISISSTVAGALAAFACSGDEVALVLDHGEPVGVVTRADLLDVCPSGAWADARLIDVMDLEVVRVNPTSDANETLRAYREAGWCSLWRRRPRHAETAAARARLARDGGWHCRRPPCPTADSK